MKIRKTYWMLGGPTVMSHGPLHTTPTQKKRRAVRRKMQKESRRKNRA